MQWAPAPVVGDYVVVPKGVIERNKTVTLAAKMFFVDGIGFLLMVLRNIKFITAKHVATCTAKSLSKHLLPRNSGLHVSRFQCACHFNGR